ncbi:ribonuclease H1 small subunit [Xylona heveae TC161]|uniref:Ribonuclease H1 small subunit n=1 Tax=Xylona heveae (strain CBS 132557 / TC161) TaxID=1328760 RepID=A0A165HBH6_XYLHT|nr:ribonuclease H1 small subunit [Xylona heveae TC161]KZF23256.1 ribonuclease H1 small subunit [Xylona heveae TC161]
MLAIKRTKSESSNCSPNILPCRINHNGSLNASSRFWAPKTEDDEKMSAYFRGRKLVGRALKVPEGYEGIVAASKGERLPHNHGIEPRRTSVGIMLDEGVDEEGEEDIPPTKILEQQASFDELIIWGHEAEPDEGSDAYLKGIQEWIQFSEAMHSHPTNAHSQKKD